MLVQHPLHQTPQLASPIAGITSPRHSNSAVNLHPPTSPSGGMRIRRSQPTSCVAGKQHEFRNVPTVTGRS